MDITKKYLNEKEQKVFNKFGENGEAFLTLEEFQILRPTGLIQERLGDAGPWSNSWPESGLCRLSGDGEKYQRYYLAQRAAERKSARRYWITTGIAITALILSAISIVLQYE